MIEVTGVAQQAAWRRRQPPPVEQVRPGVWSIPVSFPGNPMRYTLSYLLAGTRECILVDPGYDSARGWLELCAGIRSAGHVLGDICGVVATHFHQDHLGMARRVARAAGSWIALGQDERRFISDYTEARREVASDFLRMECWGVPAARRAEAVLDEGGLEGLRALPDPDLRLGDGALLPIEGLSVRVQSTPGHTPGHICLWDEDHGLILSGDHVLPRITPNVSLEVRGMADPLGRYLGSLEKLYGSPEHEVCPAHEYRFRGISERAAQIHAHCLERAAEVARTAAGQRSPTVWSVASGISWSRGWDSLSGLQLRLALSETAAHLVHLQIQGADLHVPGLSLQGARLAGTL